jgi:hypothetical protein
MSVLLVGGFGVVWGLRRLPLLGSPVFEPNASFLPVVAPEAALLALLLGVARPAREPAAVLALECLVALELLGAARAYVLNGVADRSPAQAVPSRIVTIGVGRSGPAARLTSAPGAGPAPDLSIPTRLRGGSQPPRAGATVLVHVQPGALGLPWIDPNEAPAP